jgi:beta-mannosidase
MSLNTLDLNGVWRVRWTDGQRGRVEYANRDSTDAVRYLDATVPGEIHLDLMKAGLIGEPADGLNCLASRWVEEMIWSYRREFTAPRAALVPGARAWLVFETLDLAASIVLNGKEVGKHRNVFRPCRIDVTGALRTGRNVLAVHVEGGLYDVSERPGAVYNGQTDHRLHKRSWLRKPQCQFSWDWSARLVNVGITGSVRLEWTADAVRVDGIVPLASLTPDLRKGTVRTRVFVEGLGTTPVKGSLDVELSPGAYRVSVPVEIKPGLNPVEATIEIADPALWWPVGCGPQALYSVVATLRVKGRTVGSRTAAIGFRRVEVDQSPHPSGGRSFVITVNGRKVFCKGGNFVPADLIFARIDRDRYDTLTDRALEANFNMLRVWGGGLYEGDDFYELCDRKGILVWQEFIFACSKYPATDAAFVEDFRQEARHQIRRLAAHPSLVVWCGNNEMEWGAWDWAYDKYDAVLPDYALFHNVIPRLLAEEDPTRYYQPSSPYSPDGVTPNRDDRGDQHPWSVGFADTDFRKYRAMACRFPNEGGILGPTSLPTMLRCMPEGHRRVQSFAWQIHDNSVDSWGEPSYPDGMIRQWLGLDVRRLSIEDFVYWGGLVQGEGLREYVDNFRRRMFDSASAIFWMYNDCWPATRSWTIVDYALRRTPAFWAVKRAMAPVSVVLAEEGDKVAVFGVNDTNRAVAATLRFGVFTLAGRYPVDREQAVRLAPNASTRLAEFPARQWTRRRAGMAFGVLTRGGEVLARNRLFEPFFKDLAWSETKVRVRVRNGRATFAADRFVWGVCLDLDGGTALADNFFDLYPGQPYTIPWRRTAAPRIIHVGNELATAQLRT